MTNQVDSLTLLTNAHQTVISMSSIAQETTSELVQQTEQLSSIHKKTSNIDSFMDTSRKIIRNISNQEKKKQIIKIIIILFLLIIIGILSWFLFK
jgi:hypothetical protein